MASVHLWHPVLVHFTIGLLSTSVVLYFAARFLGTAPWRERFRVAAELNLWMGALVTGLTVGAGMIAFGSAPQGEDAAYLKAVHSWFAYGTFTLFALLAALSAWRRRRDAAAPLSGSFLAGLLLALAALGTTGYLGGELVFHHGVGVQIPQR
jgi:uncharacterized membrane protein